MRHVFRLLASENAGFPESSLLTAPAVRPTGLHAPLGARPRPTGSGMNRYPASL